jgi:hypothetical protein
METVEAIKVHGMFRVNIVNPNGEIVGDSGWRKNAVTDLGFNKFLIMSLGSIAGSLYVSHMALGTGAEPAVADTALDGELVKRQAVTAATSATTFASANSFTSATQNISNIGLFNSSSTGSIFAGNTFASSSCATNQSVNCTYDVTFA